MAGGGSGGADRPPATDHRPPATGHRPPTTDHVPSFPIDTKRCATLGEPQCLHEAGRGWNSQDWPCRVDSAVSHSRTNIGMTSLSCERGCARFYVALSF